MVTSRSRPIFNDYAMHSSCRFRLSPSYQRGSTTDFESHATCSTLPGASATARSRHLSAKTSRYASSSGTVSR